LGIGRRRANPPDRISKTRNRWTWKTTITRENSGSPLCQLPTHFSPCCSGKARMGAPPPTMPWHRR